MSQDPHPSLGKAYFDELYGRSPTGDPWNFAASPYEDAKYSTTLRRLPRARYRSVLEVGCSIGVFTRRLAERADMLLCLDINPIALAQARIRCADQPQVRFALADLTEDVPAGPFDLIVLAEVAYYWTPNDFERIFRTLLARLDANGQIMLVHWRAAVPDYPQTGDEVHRHAGKTCEAAGLVHRDGLVEAEYRLDVWERTG